MTDLGRGVYEQDGEAVNGRVGPVAPRDRLTCPWCGLHDRTGRVDHPDYAFFCACGGLFTGTDAEWGRLARHRKNAVRRRNRSESTGPGMAAPGISGPGRASHGSPNSSGPTHMGQGRDNQQKG